eukprot:TRINITY_DN4057_c0_g1_i2.p1 TRINITY_DN4057_c0_g1~~TRINITY_DN4057_c0_g1_i2.p1  ORF type:complete len:132 (+),score=28.13 TRINITY_DN4057_c0_g1_i2:389-784(+)
MEREYPEAWSRIKPHQLELSSTPYHVIQSNFTEFNIKEANLQGWQHPSFLSTERFTQMDDPSLGYVRAFLMNEVGLTHLFRGDGMTQNEKGEPGIKEFLIANRRIDSFSTYHLFDLDILDLTNETQLPSPS